MNHEVITRLKRGLIVSCQAPEGTPLHGSAIMAAMARAAEMGGAVGIRADGPSDIRAIKRSVGLPVLGIYKIYCPDCEPYITPTLRSAEEIVEAGADIVALDATLRPRLNGLAAAELIAQVRALGVPVMADISTLEEGVAAAESGADIVSTTLSGYTPYSPKLDGPDFDLLEALVKAVDAPVICEGRVWTPGEAREALDLGAHAVVVGTAITRPHVVTERFVKRMR